MTKTTAPELKALQLTVTGEVNEVTFAPDATGKVISDAVGGDFQVISLRYDIDLWVNEEGKNIGLPRNKVAQVLWDMRFGKGTDVIVGDVLLTGGADDEGATLGLSTETIDLVTRILDRAL